MLEKPLFRFGVGRMLLVIVYFLVASASFSGYFSKWAFRDGVQEFSLPAMLDGTADRPFVYRQLLPGIANGIERALPDDFKQHALTILADGVPSHHPITFFYAQAKDAANPQYALRYYLVYAMAFGALFLALFALRAVCLELQINKVAATLAPLAFALIFPLTLTEGGYFYDLVELLFMPLAVWLALRGRILELVVVTALATLNKESFLFFVLTLFPFLRARFSLKTTCSIEFGLLVVATVVNAIIKIKYSHNAGGIVQFHLWENLRFLAHPSSYMRFEYNYGIVTPKGFNVINIFAIALLVRASWAKLSPAVRQHLKIAAVVNVPLFLAFCFHDELRNFSMLNVGFVAVLGIAIDAYLERGYSRSAPQMSQPVRTKSDTPFTGEIVVCSRAYEKFDH